MGQDKLKDLICTCRRNYENAKSIYERLKVQYDSDIYSELKETNPEQYQEYRKNETETLEFYQVVLERSKEQLDRIINVIENNQ